VEAYKESRDHYKFRYRDQLTEMRRGICDRGSQHSGITYIKARIATSWKMRLTCPSQQLGKFYTQKLQGSNHNVDDTDYLRSHTIWTSHVNRKLIELGGCSLKVEAEKGYGLLGKTRGIQGS
jgi:hypothetical protein